MHVIDHKPQMRAHSHGGASPLGIGYAFTPAAWQGPESLLTRVGSRYQLGFSLALALPRSTWSRLRVGSLFHSSLSLNQYRCNGLLRAADRNCSGYHLFRHGAEHLRHSSKSSISVADQPSDGARGIVPVQTGELPSQRGERQHVRCS